MFYLMSWCFLDLFTRAAYLLYKGWSGTLLSSHSIPLRLWTLSLVNRCSKKECRPEHVLHIGSLLIAAWRQTALPRVPVCHLSEDLANLHIPKEVSMVSVCFAWICLKSPNLHLNLLCLSNNWCTFCQILWKLQIVLCVRLLMKAKPLGLPWNWKSPEGVFAEVFGPPTVPKWLHQAENWYGATEKQ